MFNVSESAIIQSPPAEVFDVASDPETQLKWDPETLKSVEKLSPGPLGRGSRYRGKFKGFGTMEYEFPDFEPGKRFAHHARMKMGEMRHTFTFDPVPQGTNLTQVGVLKPNLLGRVMWPMMSRMLRKQFKTIAAEVSDYLASSKSTGQPSE